MKKFTVLVAIDFSKSSYVVLEKALSFTNQMDGELHVVHVVESSFFSKKIDLESTKNSGFLKLSEKFSSIKKENYHCVSGKVKIEVANTANILNADMVIMGNSGETNFLDALIMGSHTKEIIKHAQTPILIMKKEHELKYENILILTDMSQESAKAIKYTAKLFANASITLVNLFYMPLGSTMSLYGMDPQSLATYQQSIQEESQGELESFLDSLSLPQEIDVTASSIKSTLSAKTFNEEVKGIKHDILVIHATQNVSFFAFDILEQSLTDVFVVK
ncbi:UspA [Sulfurimonas denitrificans DSM 1251]|uniref:UspA n=1 Tax=Sulfurimonas denitrificans (strain ATCC 33889 / DSM 1251) TaxID=326298 RepID=Q30R38_SULDN|nr:universal stress protein [Sulfurimonas denitrificans]ABB44543.1 UspA [Sulfurimonas denitrificans DSM 1251]MDD3441727.1 universal stress protein [Sulfurimonas denitrificans]